jgi:hypothetical protein
VKPPTLSRSSVLCRCGGASLQGVEKQYSVRPYADASALFCSQSVHVGIIGLDSRVPPSKVK